MNEERTNTPKRKKRPHGAPNARSRMYRLLAGGYLVYLAYQLISGAVGQEGWPTMKIVGLAAGILFAAIGLWLFLANVKEPQMQDDTDTEEEKPDEGDAL